MSAHEPEPASVFIVEDDPGFRETFIDVMSLRGVNARGAGSASEGLRVLRDIRPAVIILDVKLPDIHGFDLCRKIRRMDAFRRTPIIFVSASAQFNDPRDRVEGVLAGGQLFLTKPVTADRLWTEIDGLIKGRA
jgi:two-component system, OmpR family, response regulator